MTSATPSHRRPVERDDPAPHVARLRLSRPEGRNAMTAELRETLRERMTAALQDPDVRAVILAGSPKAFSGGGDVSSMSGLDTDAARARMVAGHRLVRTLAGADVPVVAAVTGWAIGAAVGLMLLADTVIAGRSTRVGFPFLRLALVPDWGISTTLPQRVGAGRARQLLLRSAVVGADEALAIDLVDEVVEDDDVDAVAVARATEFAALPRQALALTKRMLGQSRELERALDLEAASQALSLVSPDAEEGRTAFQEKREPRYRPL